MHPLASLNRAPTKVHATCILTSMEMAILAQSDHKLAVGARLRQLIDALDISYAQAARDMGVTKNHLGNWMRGNGPYPYPYNLYRFCRIRGVDLNWVFLGDPSSLPSRVASRLMGMEPGRVVEREQASQAVENPSKGPLVISPP